MRHNPINPPTQQFEPVQDRTAYLRSLLNKPEGPDLVMDIAREVGRLAVEQDKDVSRIPYILMEVANLNLAVRGFMEDQLVARQKREKGEAENARQEYERKKKDEQFTSQKIEAVRMGSRMNSAQTAYTPVPFAVWFPTWFRDKVLPWMVIIVIGWIAAALWAFFKASLGVP